MRLFHLQRHSKKKRVCYSNSSSSSTRPTTPLFSPCSSCRLLLITHDLSSTSLRAETRPKPGSSHPSMPRSLRRIHASPHTILNSCALQSHITHRYPSSLISTRLSKTCHTLCHTWRPIRCLLRDTPLFECEKMTLASSSVHPIDLIHQLVRLRH